ncbi:MAG: hypothetical protein JNL50_08460 [Phycisphaerae bacterium]|nr:hypothetical protein [Phycisphaerae bacterium]
MLTRNHSLTLCCLTLAALAGGTIAINHASAQCDPAWHAVGGPAGGDTTVWATTMWDPDGVGPQAPVLVVAGEFLSFNGTPVNNIAVWNGASWSTLGDGVGGAGTWVTSLAALANGDLIAGGTFTNCGVTSTPYIARWNGAAWVGMAGGMDNQVNAMTVSRATGELYATGFFTTAGGTPANRVARWTGSGWAALGSGLGNIGWAITSRPNGDIVVGGSFTTAGNKTVNRLARWSGGQWFAMSGGTNSTVLSVLGLDNGDVVLGGTFTTPTARVVGWRDTGWFLMGSGLNAQPLTFTEMPNGDIIAGGHFFASGATSVPKIARFDGTDWRAMGTGMDQFVMTTTVDPHGDLWAGGGFSTAGGVASPFLARWGAGGAPEITTQPASETSCPGGPALFDLVVNSSDAPSYQWRVESPADSGVYVDLAGASFHEIETGLEFDVAGADLATLSVSGVKLRGHGNVIRLVGRATNSCGSVTSDVATLTICAADFTCDRFVNGDDYDAFASVFDVADPAADMNFDGFVNGDDYDAFASAFDAGC